MVVGVLAMADFGREDCGVGSSEAALAGRVGDVEVLDVGRPGLLDFRRQARAAAGSGAVCVGVYPTTSTVYRPGLLPRALLLRLAFGRRRFRLHLHEFQHLRRLLRWPVQLALLLTGQVVVSSPSEAAAVGAALGGLVGRRCRIVVAAPVNGAAPSPAELEVATGARDAARAQDRERTVGVFGLYRPDKGAAWLEAALAGLEPRFDRLVLAGRGWAEHRWTDAVRARYQIELLGHVPRAELAPLFAGWGLAVAPLWGPAHDGRMSLRTPLAFGVPTLTVGPPTEDLRLTADHLRLLPPADPGALAVDGLDRRTGAEQVAAFERAVTDELAQALFAP